MFRSFQSISFALLLLNVSLIFYSFKCFDKWNIFLISFLNCLFYRNILDFCLLTSYPTTLLNFFISSNSFSADSLGFSMYKITSSTNRHSSNSSFLSWTALISFYCLISQGKIFSIILNGSVVSRHPCFVPDLKGKSSRLSSLPMMLVLIFLQIEEVPFYFQFV